MKLILIQGTKHGRPVAERLWINFSSGELDRIFKDWQIDPLSFGSIHADIIHAANMAGGKEMHFEAALTQEDAI